MSTQGGRTARRRRPCWRTSVASLSVSKGDRKGQPVIQRKIRLKRTTSPSSTALQARELCDYIAGPDAGRPDERIEHRGAVNMLNLDHSGQVDEFADLAAGAHWSARPFQHWIVSWPEEEQSTATQADEA